MTYAQQDMIRQFAADFGGFGLQVRGPMHKEVGAREIRSKRHTHLAIKWDDLGNAFVLTDAGFRLHLGQRDLN